MECLSTGRPGDATERNKKRLVSRSWHTTFGVAIAVLVCIATLTACAGPSSNRQSTSTTSPPPGAGDVAICQIVSKATAAYNSKDYTSWRLYIAQVGSTADSAQYLPLKRYAEKVKHAISEGSTTSSTTKPDKSSRADRLNVSGLFNALGGYLGLKQVCATLPTSQ